MSKKLTEQKIDELIEELLQEENPYIGARKLDNYKDELGLKRQRPTKPQISKLAQSDRSPSLSPKDVAIGARRPDNSPEKKAVQSLADKGNYKKPTDIGKKVIKKANKELVQASGEELAKSADAEDVTKAAEVDISKAKEIAAATQEDIFSFDLRNAQSALGQFPASLLKVYRTLFKDKNSLIGRLSSMTEFSQKILQASKSKKAAKEVFGSTGFNDFILNVMAMDYVSSIAKSLDDNTGAYMFESFLALISGGKVVGKEKADTGTMGAADFTIGDKVKGSAKYYNDFNKISQSSKGFDLGANNAIHYIVALKKSVESATHPKEHGISDPLKLKSVDLYYIIIHYVGEDDDGNKVFVIRDPELNGLGIEVAAGGGDVKLNKTPYYTDATKIGTLVLVDSNTTKFREMVQEASSNISEYFGEAMKRVKETYQKDQEFKTKTTGYVADGNLNAGNSMIESLNELLLGVQAMTSAFEKIEGYEAPEKKIAAPTSESKQQTLNDLIAETMRDIKKKRKK